MRLRTILIIIAMLTILMGLCQAVQRAAPHHLEGGTIGITTYGLTVLTRHVPGGAQSVETYEYEEIPLEFIVVAVFLLATSAVQAASYLSRRGRGAKTGTKGKESGHN